MRQINIQHKKLNKQVSVSKRKTKFVYNICFANSNDKIIGKSTFEVPMSIGDKLVIDNKLYTIIGKKYNNIDKTKHCLIYIN